MRVLLKTVLDCDPDVAWVSIRRPAVFRAVSSPLVGFDSLEAGGFPDLWEAGEHPVVVKALGLVPIGEQIIGISFPKRRDGVRVMRDTGRGLSGPLALVTRWQHTMAIAAAPGGKTLYRDQLIVEAGALTPVLWVMYWAFWQFRAVRMRALAPTWN
jgi:hypothetical protein